MGLGRKILSEFSPSQRILGGGPVGKMSGELPIQWKGTGVGGGLDCKNQGIPRSQLKDAEVTPL